LTYIIDITKIIKKDKIFREILNLILRYNIENI